MGMAEPEYDVIIVGGGPGGLGAAIFSGLRGMRTLVLEGGSFGGLLTNLYPQKTVLNYPGYPEGIKAAEIAEGLVEQARAYGVEMRNERVLRINSELVVETEEGSYTGKAVIIATGSRPRVVGILGEAELNQGDRGVYYYVTDPQKFSGKRVVVAGGGDTAVDAALALEDVASEVILVHRRDSFRALEHNVKRVLDSEKIHVRLETRVQEIMGSERVESVRLIDKEGNASEVRADAVVLAFGLVPNNEIFQDLGLELDYEGRIVTDAKQKTSVEGVYAVGDIVAGTGSLELIIVALAQGAIAAHHAYLETAEPYWG
ncbi:MAG: NAD(P)/FAD-dependent oxidoreductase [Methanobacteriota archaeon]|nr:MAG: NAD(P)/FAD-dependent oxidoreductase [Euryarchaeota archaeon]